MPTDVIQPEERTSLLHDVRALAYAVGNADPAWLALAAGLQTQMSTFNQRLNERKRSAATLMEESVLQANFEIDPLVLVCNETLKDLVAGGPNTANAKGRRLNELMRQAIAQDAEEISV